ncbi:type-F conjugative transfer system secretin TraK [Pseudoduganella lurida]|uniref:type-F conjugative transfer system secretin TraK n=1 Tax=Pseudoduganella lurida TaxID=1036180 RepID=UPI00131590CA|nr:type-F conjugative transfer system secretin TraK [Pseudoduganella lurida]
MTVRRLSAAALCASLFVAIPGTCAQIIDARDAGVVYAKVSKRELTRIALDRGRIAVLRAKDGELHVDADEDTGQLFVSLPEGADKPINAFLTTTDGATVTLLLQPADIPADSIILRTASTAVAQRTAPHADTHVRAQRRLLAALAGDEVPPDADLREVSTPRLLWREAAMTLQRQLLTRDLVAERYLVTNRSPDPMVLEERELYHPGVNAIAIDLHSLAPGEGTAVYVVRERHGDD